MIASEHSIKNAVHLKLCTCSLLIQTSISNFSSLTKPIDNCLYDNLIFFPYFVHLPTESSQAL